MHLGLDSCRAKLGPKDQYFLLVADADSCFVQLGMKDSLPQLAACYTCFTMDSWQVAPQLVCRPCCSSLLQGFDGSLAHTARQCQGGVSCCAATDDHKHLGLGRKHRGCSYQGCANLSQPKAHYRCQIAGSEVCAGRGKVQYLVTHCSLCAGLSEQKPPAPALGAQSGTADVMPDLLLNHA